MRSQKGNGAITEELHALGRLFEMEGLEDKRSSTVLERVNLNFRENGKSAKKRRVDITADGLGIYGKICFIN